MNITSTTSKRTSTVYSGCLFGPNGRMSVAFLFFLLTQRSVFLRLV